MGVDYLPACQIRCQTYGILPATTTTTTTAPKEERLHQTASILLFDCISVPPDSLPSDHPRAASMVEYACCQKLCTRDYFINRIRSFKNPPLKQGHTTIILLMLLLCGNMEFNPGPGKASIYHCGCCGRIINWSHKAVSCDDCSVWCHKTCISMCPIDYEGIESASRCCSKCNILLSITHAIFLLTTVSMPYCLSQVTLILYSSIPA